ncbi:hypothetical protein INR49_005855 [Caranx melampygus]|nr:hypothetical protein INR49_005855 [Caranx melampygus]
MAAPQRSEEKRESVEETDTVTMFDVLHRTVREVRTGASGPSVRAKIVLQRLIVIARLPHDLADRTELGAHYEKLNFQLSKQFIWDHVTGLLLIYPSHLLHVIESSREVLLSVLRDLQQQTHCSRLGAAKVVFMAHAPRSRLFQQWSYKVLDANQVTVDPKARGHEEEEEEQKSTESLVCSVLSVLQNAAPWIGSGRDPELIVSQEVLEKLLGRDELQSPHQFLQVYDSPLDISMDFGQVIGSRCLTRV